ncbi:putative IMV phosphorylated membrane [Equine parapoxvirus]|nr:putative IMV phosphorylated membrane [Equine parapoxvirus]WOC35504.1 putative IMV phosphorylated membrane [Equine parapoxvirus]WOC35521.1 putative IMV phosphorylated membrane [Equine parapoxvirus]
MDIFEAIRSYYSGVLVCGVLLLGSACVFAFVDFSKTAAHTTEYVWRALSITCFLVGAVMLLGLIVLTMYRRCGKPAAYERFNQTDIELTGR